MTEKEMKEMSAPWPKTLEELNNFIEKMIKEANDYGTCVYAMSLSSVATFNYIAHEIGATGFQAGCADLDILKRIRGYTHGFCVIDYDKILYPQYYNNEYFPSLEDIIEKNRIAFAFFAKEKMKHDHPSEEVWNHWNYLYSRATKKEIEEFEKEYNK